MPVLERKLSTQGITGETLTFQTMKVRQKVRTNPVSTIKDQRAFLRNPTDLNN